MHWRRFLLPLLGLAALAAGILLWPPKPVDLRRFDAAELARHEAGAWRAYYEEKYPALFRDVFQTARSGYGFSLRDTIALASFATRSAWYFRRSSAPDDIAAALGQMQGYYRLISLRSECAFDWRQAAELELAWWQMRRKKLPPEEWARCIARQCHTVYGDPEDRFLPAARLRVSAMVQRDSLRDTVMSEEDWAGIQDLLLRSYREIREVLDARDPTASQT